VNPKSVGQIVHELRWFRVDLRHIGLSNLGLLSHWDDGYSMDSPIIANTERPDLVHGVRAIAQDQNLTERKAYHLLVEGLIPGSFRLGKTWSLSRAANRAEIARMAQTRASVIKRTPRR
jgi:hypothetical protein